MRATTAFEQLAQAYGATLGESLAPLREALQVLDLQRAAAACRDLHKARCAAEPL